MNPPRAPTHVLYLHGFRSSPRSFKSLRMQHWLQLNRPAVQWWCPQLPPSPNEAMALVRSGVADWPAGRFAIIGSSLGGFYATCLAESSACPVVLLNPAVDPARDLAAHVGEQTAYHDPTRRFEFLPAHVEELRRLRPETITRPERYLVVIAKGDELLDWREMRDRYAGASMRIIEGSDHALSDFDEHLPPILRFLGLAP